MPSRGCSRIGRRAWGSRPIGGLGSSTRRDFALRDRVPPEATLPLPGEDLEARIGRIVREYRRIPGESPADMFFRYWGDNPFVDTTRDAQATFGLDVDTASYTLARSYLARGILPPKEAIRTEEFVNYFPSNYAAPQDGDFALYGEIAPSWFSHRDDVFLLKVGVKAREVAEEARKPLALTFVIDVFGSMAKENRLELVKDSIRVLLDEIDERDSVGIVVFESTARAVLEPVHGSSEAIRAALLPLRPGSSTNVQQGLDLGYAMALRQKRSGATSRVLLLSDGVANTGDTTVQGILSRVESARREGIFLSCFGVGMGNHNDAILEQLADRGDGQCAYIDTVREAVRVFRQNLAGSFQPVATDAKVQVDFAPEVVAAFRQIGYENRAIADRDFRNDTIDAGEVNAGQEVVALFEMELRPRMREELLAGRVSPATARLRYRQWDRGEVIERTLETRSSGIDDFENASPRFRLSAAVAAFADLLRGSFWSRAVRYAELVEVASSLATLDAAPGGPVTDFLALLHQAERLVGQGRVLAMDPSTERLLYNYYLRTRHADLEISDRAQLLERLEAENRRLEQELRALLPAAPRR